MPDSEVERLRREIKERQDRLAVLDVVVTREQLAGMTAYEIRELDPAVVRRALTEETAQ